MHKHIILFLAANPLGTDRLAFDREASAIQRELERSQGRDCFEFVTRLAAEPLDLLHELRKLRPTVLHFSGRGGRGAPDEFALLGAPPRDVVNRPEPCGTQQRHGLVFQTHDGQAQLVTAEALRNVFASVTTCVKLVVLNACYTEPQADALLDHVDFVVGMGGAIDDDAARYRPPPSSRTLSIPLPS